jgi:uncharacterized membrane protein|tara:strand:+ start:704 stop:1318 length:615 start_codon:yes stop_codon:yes gene_type:complete
MSGHIHNHNGEEDNTTTTSSTTTTTVSPDVNENDTSTTTIPTTTTTVVEAKSDPAGFLPQFIKHPSVVHFPIAYSVAIPFIAFILYRAIANKSIKFYWWFSVVFTQAIVFILLLLARYTGNLLYIDHGYDVNPTNEIEIHSLLGTSSIYINLLLLFLSVLPFVSIYKQNSYNPFSIIKVYLVLSLGNAFFILYIGYLGGKIVWG